MGSGVVFEEGAGRVPVDLIRDAEGRVTGATLTAPQPLTVGKTIPAAVVAGGPGLPPPRDVPPRRSPDSPSLRPSSAVARGAGDARRAPPPPPPCVPTSAPPR